MTPRRDYPEDTKGRMNESGPMPVPQAKGISSMYIL